MRAVNLLPERDRVRGPAQVPAGSSRLVLGVLGALLLAVLVLVLSQNQITGRKAQIATAQQEQKQAEVRSAQLGSFGEFSQIKKTRVTSISTLAKSRFDYERLMRELALVLPEDTWVTEVDASTTGSPDATAGATPAPAPSTGPTPAPAPSTGTATSAPPSTGTTTGAPAAPSVKIVGCAKTQSTVAETMVRLRNLHRVEDVELTDSTRPAKASASGPTGSSTPAAGSTGTGCGKRYSFDATVTFVAAPADAEQGERGHRVPTVLGGGS
ncbi:MAG: hypothetical protein ACR2J6_04475 [Thermoleophilaceae bacterium]